MKFFDLHCDTLYRAVTENGNLNNHNFHISIDKGKKYNPWIQCYAIWISDTLRGKNATKFVEEAYKLFKKEKAITQISDKSNLEYFNDSAGAILSLEGSSGVEDIDDLEKLYLMGVRIITLTWNGCCRVGGGVESRLGLTSYGERFINKMQDLGIIIDLSHASQKLFYDVANKTDCTFIATHSNSKSICGNIRNLTDEQFKIILSRNGIVGINFCDRFLNDEPQKASIFDILRHTEYFLSIGGEKAVCIGSDFDGADMPKDINGIESIENIANCFLQHNYSEELVENILFNNAYNFFLKNLH